MFAQLVADGKTLDRAYAEAYECAGGNSTPRTCASRLVSTNALVRARINWLKEENAKVNALCRAEKRMLLARIARGEVAEGETPPTFRERIAAIQEDNRMTGDSVDTFNLKNESITINLGKLLND